MLNKLQTQKQFLFIVKFRYFLVLLYLNAWTTTFYCMSWIVKAVHVQVFREHLTGGLPPGVEDEGVVKVGASCQYNQTRPARCPHKESPASSPMLAATRDSDARRSPKLPTGWCPRGWRCLAVVLVVCPFPCSSVPPTPPSERYIPAEIPPWSPVSMLLH